MLMLFDVKQAIECGTIIYKAEDRDWYVMVEDPSSHTYSEH